MMKNLLTILTDQAHRFARGNSNDQSEQPEEGTSESAPGSGEESRIRLGSCASFDRVVVTTLSSVYELIVLNGSRGDVLVRGGRFDEFRRGRVLGSTAGGSALMINAIDVGLRLELQVGGKTMLTSQVQTARRMPQQEQRSQ
jgi:hypothetical protein